MRLPELKTLFKISMFTALGGISSIMYVYMKRMDELSNSDFFREAFKILRAHPGAVQYLGEPIKQLGFKIGTPENFMNDRYAEFQVRVKGPNDKGKLYMWARSNDGQWKISRLELELNKTPDRRLLIKDGPFTPQNDA